MKAAIDALPRRYRAVAVVAAGCGFRQGEAFPLRVSDVDFLRRRIDVEQQVKLLGGRVTIDKPKGGRTRAVPLPDTVAVELAEHLHQTPHRATSWSSRRREHKSINRNHFNPYIWRPALEVAGIARGGGGRRQAAEGAGPPHRVLTDGAEQAGKGGRS